MYVAFQPSDSRVGRPGPGIISGTGLALVAGAAKLVWKDASPMISTESCLDESISKTDIQVIKGSLVYSAGAMLFLEGRYASVYTYLETRISHVFSLSACRRIPTTQDTLTNSAIFSLANFLLTLIPRPTLL
jgi:hypothetical protein